MDFKSAFDTVWRKALLYKLIKNGVCGTFISVIDSMYSNVLYRVKIDGMLSSPIQSNVGVKQGCVLSPLLFNVFLSDLPEIFTYECDPVRISDIEINCLMFADDLVLMSVSATGLQKCLCKLQQYRDTWCLEINIDKTKVMIFNKGGHKISRYQFKIYETVIDIVQQYCYLGIIFSSCGSFKRACNLLYDKALKAFYMLKQIQPHNNVKIAFSLFDALVLPILSYGGIVWGPLYAKKVTTANFMSSCNDSSVEKLNIKMCKYLLGVHKKSTNDAVRGELGRYPLLIKILDYSYRYFRKINSSSSDTLVRLSCDDNDIRSLYHSWYNSISRLVDVFNQSHSFVNDMNNVYSKHWTVMMQSCTGKLRTYSQFKKQFALENYIIQFPLHLRRNFTRLRISAHNLAIETGRYTNNKVSSSQDITKRVCFHCKNIESEYHLIFECDLYNDARSKFINRLNEFTVIPFDDKMDSFNIIMSSLNGDIDVGRHVCEFINSCFKLRIEYFNIVKERNILCRPATTLTRFGRVSKRPNRIDL